MTKIYVASSRRNPFQPAVVVALRADGHEVYDFRNPTEGYTNPVAEGLRVDEGWESWTVRRD